MFYKIKSCSVKLKSSQPAFVTVASSQTKMKVIQETWTIGWRSCRVMRLEYFSFKIILNEDFLIQFSILRPNYNLGSWNQNKQMQSISCKTRQNGQFFLARMIQLILLIHNVVLSAQHVIMSRLSRILPLSSGDTSRCRADIFMQWNR